MQRQRIQDTLLTPSNIPFSREYTDLLSGTNPNRKDYQQMLSDAAAGKFSHLGLYRADRFGRNTVEGLQAATQLMSMGIKIRIANMLGLQPENPDGYFLFLLQMGLAQREVDVLAQRTAGGMEAKMRAGGWPHKAPEGYVNKERQISSNKYERWVEADPEQLKALKDAWELLLTDRYTLAEICEELNHQGYVRSSGHPWAWTDPKSGNRKTAANV
jgi:DNA invertase Pin-like site-specific DNA recombinase